MGGSFTVARIRGIAIEIHPTWLLIVGLLAYTLAEGVLPDQYEDWSPAQAWTVGIISAVLLFVTVLIHELAHALVAIARGIEVPKITLFIFGGVSHLATQPKSAREEFWIAIAGPLTSVAIAGVCFGTWVILGGNDYIEAIFSYLATVNVLLAVFNIVPGFPLDGGRVLRAIAWGRTKSFRRATQIAGDVGVGIAYIMMIGGGLLLLSGFLFNGIWFMFIGWFLLNAARAETQDVRLESVLGRLRARDVMRADFVTVQPGVPLQTIVDQYMLGEGERAVVVALDGAVSGILSVSDVRKVPREQWPSTPAQRVMTTRERVVTVSADEPAVEVLAIIGRQGLNQVPVLEDGRMVGLITRRELLERVQLAESLGAR